MLTNQMHTKLPLFLRYVLAAVIYGSALLLCVWIFPPESGLFFITFYPATVICFYLCGIGPGVILSLLSALTVYLFFVPAPQNASHLSGGEITVAAYLVTSTLIAFIVHPMQRHAEQLRDSEQRYRGILEDQTEFISRFKADGCILYVNDAYCRFFGKTRESLIGVKWQPATWNDDIATNIEKMRLLTPANPVVTIEQRVATAQGGLRWCQFVNRAFFDADGNLLEVQSVGRDITEKKQAELSLRNESRKYEALLNAASDGVYILDEQGNLVQFSDSFTRLLGYNHEELAGLNIVAWEVGIPGNKLLGTIKNLIGRTTTVETRYHRKDGTVIDVETNAIGSELEGRHYLYVSSRDITERKMLEQKLAESAKEFEDLYDQAPCGYHSVARDGTILRINATELAWLGYSREEVVGKMKISDFYTPASKKLFERNFPDFIKNGTASNLEYELIGKDGGIKHVILNATAITDAAGNFLKSRTVLHDITELKHAQERLGQLTKEQHMMLDNELVGILKIRDRRIIWHNRAIDRIFGYEVGELEGLCTRILYPDDASFQDIVVTAYPIIREGNIYRGQLQGIRKDGEKIWVDLNGMLLSVEKGESLWMAVDITALKKYQEKIERIAYHDVLTGLPNRLLFADRLNQALAQAKRTNRFLAVCYLDLDDFKPVNDKYGHTAGDRLLQELAARMQDAVRANDTVGRFGGDEFVLMLTNLDYAIEYKPVLERVTEAINKPVSLDESRLVSVGASIGVALFPADSDDPDILLRHADQAMYQAKKSGRNRVHLFNS